MNSGVLNSAYYHSKYFILQAAFERFGALYIHKFYYKHLTPPGLLSLKLLLWFTVAEAEDKSASLLQSFWFWRFKTISALNELKYL